MDSVLRGLNWKVTLVFQDDICIFSRSFAEHLGHLGQVFQCLRDANLKLKISKCHFAKPEVKYLGHIVSKEGVKPDPEKIRAIKDYPVPHNLKTLRQALGLFGYYRRFCENYSKIANPLFALLKKNSPFVWTEQCMTAFETLKFK